MFTQMSAKPPNYLLNVITISIIGALLNGIIDFPLQLYPVLILICFYSAIIITSYGNKMSDSDK